VRVPAQGDGVRVVSVQVGLPRGIRSQGELVTTGIFKSPVTEPVMVRTLNVDGDRQADLTVHGGIDKAVYAYPAEHYAFWHTALPDHDLPPGMFGENLTTEGLDEQSLHIGDRLGIGEAELVVTQPRLPCFKLGLKFDRPAILKEFLRSRRTGWYFRVEREGWVWPDAPIRVIERHPLAVAVADITRLYAFDREDVGGLRQAIQLEDLPSSWVETFEALLARAEQRGR
jgi:MOSC domain-containing protein YiiM